jgi:hypothetical protein
MAVFPFVLEVKYGMGIEIAMVMCKVELNAGYLHCADLKGPSGNAGTAQST